MAWGDEEIVDGGYLGKSYIVHENYDGSKTIYEQGPMGGRGAEVGKEVYSKLYGYTKVSANGGSINVYNPSIYGPDLNTGSGVSRALRDASGNAPRSSSPNMNYRTNKHYSRPRHSSRWEALDEWSNDSPGICSKSTVKPVVHKEYSTIIRVFIGIGVGFISFLGLAFMLPWVIGFYIFVAIFLGIFIPSLLNSWVWGVFSVVLFLFPFPVGFYLGFTDDGKR